MSNYHSRMSRIMSNFLHTLIRLFPTEHMVRVWDVRMGAYHVVERKLPKHIREQNRILFEEKEKICT